LKKKISAKIVRYEHCNYDKLCPSEMGSFDHGWSPAGQPVFEGYRKPADTETADTEDDSSLVQVESKVDAAARGPLPGEEGNKGKY
jgi:hypothetical protein